MEEPEFEFKYLVFKPSALSYAHSAVPLMRAEWGGTCENWGL